MRLIAILLAAALIVSLRHHSRPEAVIQDTMLHRADYQRCIRIRNEPLTPSRPLDPKQTKDMA